MSGTGVFTQIFVRKAKEYGINNLHFHIEVIEKKDTAVFNGETEHISASSETLILIEGEYKGFIGSSYTEDLDTERIPGLIKDIMQTASLNAVPYAEKPIRDLPVPDITPVPFDISSVAEHIISAEKTARNGNNKLVNFRMGASRQHKTVTLMNGEGKKMTDISCFISVMTNCMAKDGENVQTAHSVRLLRENPNFTELAADTASEACRMLNSEPCASGQYKAVMRNNAFAELFGAFLPAFYADKCQSGMSFMAGKLRETIASSVFSVSENPLALVSRRFDDEGTQTARKALIEKGKLAAYFHNTQTAAKDGVKSNGNGFRQDYKESISSAYTNVIVENGSKTLPELLAAMGDGILITAVDGVFAGVNPVSGDFSVLAKGFIICNGMLCEPVSGITIGGNLPETLASVQETGNDTAIIRANTGIVSSASVRLSGIVVSGKSPS